jgi:hypothetical protein
VTTFNLYRLLEDFAAMFRFSDVRRRQRLGGMLNYYYCDAA